MSVEITSNTQLILNKSIATKQVIIEIDGLPLIYSTMDLVSPIKYGDDIEYGDAGLAYGGVATLQTSKPYISINGTTKTISQQIRPDKGAHSSISKFNVEILDIDNTVSGAVSSGVNFEDILLRDATVYFGFDGGIFPEDAIPVFNGVVSNFSSGPNSVNISVSDPETLKNAEVFSPYTDELAIALTDSATEVIVKFTIDAELDIDIQTSYIIVEDEIIKYDGISGNVFTGCQRGQLGTVAVAHDVDSSIQTFYRLEERPIPLALKLMMSGKGSVFETGLSVLGINEFGPFNIQNAVFFPEDDLNRVYGLVANDRLTLNNTVSNFVNKSLILEVGKVGGFSYVVLDQTLTTEGAGTIEAVLISQYATLNQGAGIHPKQVDILGLEDIDTKIASSFPAYDFRIKESINLKDFISEEIYFPIGMYTIIRKARTSAGITVPPVASADIKVLDASSVLNPDQINPSRSINQYFYNTVKYRYNRSTLTDNFLSVRQNISADSVARIPTGEKSLEIDSSGFRDDPSVPSFLDAQAVRFFDRYQYAAEIIEGVELSYQFGITIEVGDIVSFDASSLNIYLYSEGTRSGDARLMEVINRSVSITNTIKLVLIDTGFDITGRFSIIAPSSKMAAGSTSTLLVLKDSLQIPVNEVESTRWESLIGESVVVSYNNYTTQEVTTITGVVGDNTITVAPLAVAPLEDDIIELDQYDNLSSSTKSTYSSLSPTITVSGFDFVDSSNIDVGADIGLFFIGCEVRISDGNYDKDQTTTVTNITGSVITLQDAITFTIVPIEGYLLNRIGFSSDNGDAYIYS